MIDHSSTSTHDLAPCERPYQFVQHHAACAATRTPKQSRITTPYRAGTDLILSGQLIIHCTAHTIFNEHDKEVFRTQIKLDL